MKRAIWKAGVAVVAALLFQISFEARAADRVTFQLDWLPYGKHTNYYASLDKGFYQEEGLQVQIHRGYGGQDTIKNVAAGKADLAISDPPSVVQGRAKGIQVKNIAIIFDKALQTVFVMADSGIRKPADLDGKTIGDTKASQVLAVLDAFRALHGNFNYTLVPMDPAAKNSSLIAGRVDAITTYITALPALRAATSKMGREVRAFTFSDWGLDIYSDGLIASDNTIAAQEDLARRFVRATLKGLSWSIEHPEEAVKLFHKHFATQDPSLTREFWDISVSHILTPLSRKNGIGYMDREKMKYTVGVTLKAYQLSDIPLAEIYTDRFLPQPGFFPTPPKGAYVSLKD